MAKRYELPDAAWDLVADIFSEPRRNGRPRADDRLMLNGVLWVLCSGAAWRDMPEPSAPGQRYINAFATGVIAGLSIRCSSDFTSG
jgi:transposase